MGELIPCACGCGTLIPLLSKKGRPQRYAPRHVFRIGSVEDRFWSKVEKTDTCWLWRGAQTPSGYGKFGYADKDVRPAHRVAWMLLRGDIPDGLFVCHGCDTPLCVNPDHLFLGTPRDNTLDMVQKGRGGKPPRLLGSQNRQAKLTEADVREIRQGRGTYAELARRYGVSAVLIGKVARKEVWKHVA